MKPIIKTMAILADILDLNIFELTIGYNTCLPENYHDKINISIYHITEDSDSLMVSEVYFLPSMLYNNPLVIRDFSDDEDIENIIFFGRLNNLLKNNTITTQSELISYIDGSYSHLHVDKMEVA